MALRLAGEEYSVVQGLDALGNVRNIIVSDADPGIKVNQQGSGRTFDFQDGGASVFYATDGGNPTSARDITVTTAARPTLVLEQSGTTAKSRVAAFGANLALFWNSQYDGTNYIRDNTAQGAFLVLGDVGAGLLEISGAAAAANPITWRNLFTLQHAPADGNIGVLVNRNVGGVFSLQQVSMGAVDSGGAGYKLLRVPN